MLIELRERVEVVVAEYFIPLEQLYVRLGIHICYYVVKILKISATNFSKQGRKLLHGSRNEFARVAEDHILSPLDLEVLFHV